MTIDYNTITPIISPTDCMLTCDILGSGSNWALRINQQRMLARGSKEYILAYRKKLFTSRSLSIPADHELKWNKDQAPVWTLDDLVDKQTDLYLWAKFDELDQTLSGGDSITTVTDSGPLASVLTANNGITFDAGAINSLGVANMSADNDSFSIPDHANLDINAGKLEMYCVFKTSSDYDSTLDTGISGDARYFAHKKDASSTLPRWAWFINVSTSRGTTTRKPSFERMGGSPASGKLGDATTINDSTVFLMSLIQEDNTVDHFLNGAANGTPAGDYIADPDSDGVLYIGNSSAQDSSIHGQLAEIIIIDHSVGSVPPQDAIRQKIEGYLSHKWGIEGNLPADHPYKTVPPRRDSVYSS